MTRRARFLLVAMTGACGQTSEVERARARAEAVLAPPAYEGVTTCEPAPVPTSEPPVIGFTASDPRIEVQGSLDKELISRPIRARFTAFRACYLAALELDPDAEGRVTAKFHIAADGSVVAVEIEGFDPRLDACMCDEMLRVQFPAFGSARVGGRIQVVYPFIFSR